MRGNFRVHFLLSMVALLYGSNFNVMKVITPEPIPPFTVIVMRVTGAGLLFWLFHALAIKEKIESKKDFRLLVLCSFLGVAVSQLFYAKGISITSAINGSVIMTTIPIFVLLFSAIILKERITPIKLVGVLCGMLGAVLLIGGSDFSFQSQGVIGDVILMGNAIAFAAYLVLVKPLMLKYHPITIVKWLFTLSWLMVLPFGWDGLWEVEWNSLSIKFWLAVTFVIIGATFLVYLFNVTALQKVNPSIVSFYVYFQPLVATTISILIGEGTLTFSKVVFTMLIFLGVYLVSKR